MPIVWTTSANNRCLPCKLRPSTHTTLLTKMVSHVQVAPINQGDLAMCRMGFTAGEERLTPPFTPGQDGIGVVVKVRAYLIRTLEVLGQPVCLMT